MSTTYNDNASIIYPLTAQQRGKVYIPKQDPRNTPIGLAQLKALYGEGNVIVVDANLPGAVESISMGILSQESFNPIFNVTSGLISTSQNNLSFLLNPPTNLSVTSISAVSGNDGSNSFTATVTFDDVVGATSYEGIFQPQALGYSTQPVTSLVVTPTSGGINATWAPISNANNYILSAQLIQSNQPAGKIFYAPAPITNSYTATSVSGSISGLTSGSSYNVTVTPYNSSGIAGSPATITGVVVL